MTIAIRAAGSSTSGTAPASCSAPLLIAGAARRRKAMVPFAILVATVVLQPGPPAAQAAAPVPPVIETNPPTPGMRFSVDGIPFSADVAGRAHPPPALVGSRRAVRVLRTDLRPGVRARFDRWYSGGSLAAIEVDHRVRVRFADLTGRAVDPGAVSSVTLVGSNGRRHVFDGDAPQWLQGNRVVPESGGRESTLVSYAADRVVVDGTSVVHRGQQRFFPARSPEVRLRLLLFSARFEVHDALLGFPIGSAVRLEFPDGRTRSYGLGSNGELTVGSLPRGDYRVSADALGISSSRPVSLSGDQRVELRVISWLDIALVLLALGVGGAWAAVRPPARRCPQRCAGAGGARVRLHGGGAECEGGRAPRPAVRLLLHLVQRHVLGPREDRLSGARALLERRPRRDEAARGLGEAGGDRRLHRELEEHARPESPASAAGRRGRRGELQAAGDLPGARLLPRAAARTSRRPRSRLVQGPPGSPQGVPGLRRPARDLVRHLALLAQRGRERDGGAPGRPPDPRLGAKRRRATAGSPGWWTATPTTGPR